MKYLTSVILFLIFSVISFQNCSNREISKKQDDINKSNKSYFQSDDPYRSILEKGVYITKSTDTTFVSKDLPVIPPVILADTALLSGHKLAYIAIDKPIVLFKNRNPKNKKDVAGILTTSTLVEEKELFKNHIYINSPDAPMSYSKWYSLMNKDSTYFEKYGTTITYDIWYEIAVNGKKYYTDYNLHDGIEFHAYIPSRNQILCIVSQPEFWDGVNENGAPNNYVIFILEQTPEGWEKIYQSENINLNIYDEEYTMFDRTSIKISDTKESFNVQLEGLFRISWDGKSVTVKFEGV